MDRAAPGERAARAVDALRVALACARRERDPRTALGALVASIDDTTDLDLIGRGLVAGWARVL
jgi:hypothetical protein